MDISGVRTTIKNLKNVINDPFCVRMNPSIIKGYIGELEVLIKIFEENYYPIHKGNQFGYDIEIEDISVKIDVKFSTLKTEVKNCPPYWGWVLKHKNKKKAISCTHFVCVAVDKDWTPLNYYIIKVESLNKFKQTPIKQFKNVEKGLLVLPKGTEYPQNASNELIDYFNYCERLIDNNIIRKIKPNDKLVNELID